MLDVYERGYRKVTTIQALPNGEPQLLRTGGSIIVLLRRRDAVSAADATACVDEADAPEDRLVAVERCLRRGDEAPDWEGLIERNALPVEVRHGDVWVCVDQCSRT